MAPHCHARGAGGALLVAGWLRSPDVLLDLAVEEGSLDVELVKLKVGGGSVGEEGAQR